MSRVEVVGPRDALWPSLRRIQEAGVLQVERVPPRRGLQAAGPPPDEAAERPLATELAMALAAQVAGLPEGVDEEDAGVFARRDALEGRPLLELAGRGETLRASLDGLDARIAARRDELAGLDHHLAILGDLAHLEDYETSVVLPLLVADDPAERRQVVADVEEICAGLGSGAPTRQRLSAQGRHLDALAVPPEAAGEVAEYLWVKRVPRVVFPEEYARLPASKMRTRMLARREDCAAELAAAGRERADFLAGFRVDLRAVAAILADRVALFAAADGAQVSGRAFVLVGWIPTREIPRLAAALGDLAEAGVEVRRLRFDPHAIVPPTRLENPWWARPAEVFLSFFPPPRYGSFDPSMLLLFTFPALFGWMVGDSGYGLVLLALARAAERRFGARHPIARDFARVLALAALFSVGFGILFGEFFGGLGGYLATGTWHAPVHLWMHRSGTHLTAYLLVSLAIGLLHLTMSMALGIADAWRDVGTGEPHARAVCLERGALLACLWGAVAAGLGKVLPEAGVLAPGAGATALVHGGGTLVAVASVVLVWSLPGAVKVTALFEELSILSKVVSYARLMAAGVVGVALAEIANSIGRGAAGGGVLANAAALAGAVLVHLLAFVVIIWDPLIQALRLHYVESFPFFYRPSGGVFRPLVRVEAAAAGA